MTYTGPLRCVPMDDAGYSPIVIIGAFYLIYTGLIYWLGAATGAWLMELISMVTK